MPRAIPDFLLRPWGTNLVLLALSLIFLLPGTGSMPLMDRDEPKFAQATVEMMDRGDWVVPYLNNEYRFDKPPLTYWWMALHYQLFGRNEMAARLHSVLASALTAILIAALGRFLFSPKAGLLAGLGWVTCLQVQVHVGRLCVADMPMILAVTASGYALARLLLPEEEPGKWNRWWWMLAGAQVFGFLAKGPITLAVPLLGLLLSRWAFGKSHPWAWSRLQVWPLLAVFLAGISLWGVPALLRTHGLFWQTGIGEHVVKRGTTSFNGRLPLPGFYFLTMFASFLPWSGFIPEALRRDGRPRSKVNAFLLGWLAAPYLIFSFYATMLPHYVVPGFPAFFLLLFRDGRIPLPATKFSRRWAAAVAVAFILLGSAVVGAAFTLPWSGDPAGLRDGVVGVGLLAVVSGAAAAVALSGRMVLVVLAMLAVPVLLQQVGATVRQHHPASAVARVVNQLPPETLFRAVAFKEFSLVFHTHAGWDMDGEKAIGSVAEWLRKGKEKKPRVGVFLLREWEAKDALSFYWQHRTFEGLKPSQDLGPEVRAALTGVPHHEEVVCGYNNGRTSWVELLVVTTP